MRFVSCEVTGLQMKDHVNNQKIVCSIVQAMIVYYQIIMEYDPEAQAIQRVCINRLAAS